MHAARAAAVAAESAALAETALQGLAARHSAARTARAAELLADGTSDSAAAAEAAAAAQLGPAQAAETSALTQKLTASAAAAAAAESAAAAAATAAAPKQDAAAALKSEAARIKQAHVAAADSLSAALTQGAQEQRRALGGRIKARRAAREQRGADTADLARLEVRALYLTNAIALARYSALIQAASLLYLRCHIHITVSCLRSA
jgi:trimeric autotransporter adhesin